MGDTIPYSKPRLPPPPPSPPLAATKSADDTAVDTPPAIGDANRLVVGEGEEEQPDGEAVEKDRIAPFLPPPVFGVFASGECMGLGDAEDDRP